MRGCWTRSCWSQRPPQPPASRRTRVSRRRAWRPARGGWIEPRPAELLTGDEPFNGIDASVRDFWAWSTSDLRDNTTRGMLAELIVARAVGADAPIRSAWDDYDVRTPTGVRIEVKSSAYLQSWAQAKLSEIRFSGLTGRRWDAEAGFSEGREVRADVFVFAIQTCEDPALYNPFDLAQWEFYVVPGEVVREHGARSVGLGFVRRHAIGPIGVAELAAEIESTRSANHDQEGA